MWFIAHSQYAYAISNPFALIMAIPVAAFGIFISASAIRRFKAAETTISPLQPDSATSLVHHGVFGRTRNPMYVGLFLVLLGWAVWLQSLSNIFVLIAFVLWLTELQIKPEEAALRKVFGQGYVDYCKRVRRWI
jgi:protein-S-isoprenylcysteine O-methyltransferase Ste14